MSLWKQQNTDIHTFRKEHVYTSETRLYSRRIAIEKNGNILCQPFYQLYLLRGQGSSRARHHIFYSRLMQGDHIHVALHQEAHIFARNGLFRLKQAIQYIGFMINLCFGRV